MDGKVVTETDNILEIDTEMKTPHVNLSIEEDSLVPTGLEVNSLLRVAMRTLERLPGPASPGGA
jgi:RNase P/RNase MRP subunit p29